MFVVLGCFCYLMGKKGGMLRWGFRYKKVESVFCWFGCLLGCFLFCFCFGVFWFFRATRREKVGECRINDCVVTV